MLDDYIKRHDVQTLIKSICKNNRYFDKKKDNSIDYQLFVDVEQMLFIFYDALFKYKVIIDDMYFFDDFIEQLDKLFKKINNISDITDGINRLIGRSCSLKLNIKDKNSEGRKMILKHIYDKYIVNGYYIHGYNGRYTDTIKVVGFVPGECINFDDKFIEVQNILNKHGAEDLLDKNFDLKSSFFTDSMLMGCFYSVNSPMYFYKLLCKNRFITKPFECSAYFRSDYNQCLKNINKICFKLDLNEKEKNILIDAFKCEWMLLKKNNHSMNMLVIPRKYFSDNTNINIDEFIDNSSDDSLGEAISKLLSNRNNSVCLTRCIAKENIYFTKLIGYQDIDEDGKQAVDVSTSEFIDTDPFAFKNAYGNVSLLLLGGTALISFGVLLSIIKVLGG